MELGTTNPNDIEAMQRQIAELQAQLAALQLASTNEASVQTISTGGGSVIQGGVKTQGGDFIARDQIKFITHITHTGEEPEEVKSVIAHYLQVLATDLAGVKFGEIDSSTDQSRQKPLELADIYVPLDTTLPVPEEMTLAQWLSHEETRRRDYSASERKMHPVSALEALAEHRELTILGSAGSGKSTLGASVLLTMAQVWQGHSDKLAELGERWTHGPLLPIRVILRRFAEQLPPGDQKASAGDLWNFIKQDLDSGGYGLSDDTMKYVQRIARDQGALILFDGLDECGNEARRERVMHAVQEFMRSAPKCRFLLTARPYAFPDGINPGKGIYELADLNDVQIEQFIRAWYAALVKRGWRSPGEAERKMDDLLEVRQRHDLLPLAQNPLLLTLMTTLYTNRSRLPDDRADLYHESVELLMLRWNQRIDADKALLDKLDVQGLKLSDLRKALEVLAFKIHEQSVGQDGAADIGEDELVRAFSRLLNSKDKADVVVDYIEKRAGLLLDQGEKDGERRFTFPHRTFQEFLAACHLASKNDFAAECARLAREAPGHWQVVLQLAARIAGAERGASAADNLVHGCSIGDYGKPPQIADWNCAWLAGTMLLEIGLGAIKMDERASAIAKRVAGWLQVSLPLHPDEGGLPAIQRAQAGDVLARLGDPRFDPQRFYLPDEEMLGFVEIPADPKFRIGTRKADRHKVEVATGSDADNDEINDKLKPTPAFYIAKYPVTVAQFRAFAEATGAQSEYDAALSAPDNRPVTEIDWNDARNYCVWLNEQLGNGSGAITDLIRDNNWRIDLPSELEWEKAARGKQPRAVFSWGDEPDVNRANYDETGISATSAVGCFPVNDFGLYDMLGNVWEWTRSSGKDSYAKYDFNAKEVGGKANKVVRGGSWLYPRSSSRCAYRFRFLPGFQVDFLGFRVVLRSAPV